MSTVSARRMTPPMREAHFGLGTVVVLSGSGLVVVGGLKTWRGRASLTLSLLSKSNSFVVVVGTTSCGVVNEDRTRTGRLRLRLRRSSRVRGELDFLQRREPLETLRLLELVIRMWWRDSHC